MSDIGRKSGQRDEEIRFIMTAITRFMETRLGRNIGSIGENTRKSVKHTARRIIRHIENIIFKSSVNAR